MSDGEAVTLESLLVEGSDPPTYCCIRCGIPKTREQFEDQSIACRKCASIIASRSVVTDETLQKTKFDLAAEQLQNEQMPAIPTGVQKAHKILNGRTATELYAEMIVEIQTRKTVNGEETWLPRDPKLLRQAVEGLQRAEIKHDEFLRTKPPETGVTFEEARSISIDTFIVELTRDKALRLQVLGILYERCPNLIEELMEVANVTVVASQSNALATVPELENGGVI